MITEIADVSPTKRQSALREEYGSVWQDARDYFRRFGSWRVIWASPFTHISVVVTALCYGVWLGNTWSDLPLQVLPNLLGFALAAYALLLAFGDEKFRSFLAVRKSATKPVDPIKDSLLLKVSAIFLHFVLIQIIALLLGIIGHAHLLSALHSAGLIPTAVYVAEPVRILRDVSCCAAFFLFVLSIATSANAALNIYHATRWYVEYKVKMDGPQANEAGSPTTL